MYDETGGYEEKGMGEGGDELDMYGNADYEDADIAGDIDYKMEMKAFERAGGGGKLTEFLSADTAVDEKGERKLTATDRILISIDGIARDLGERNVIKISQKDIDTMLEKAMLIPDIRYINPLAYILGYIATSGGRNMNKVRYVIDDVLPKVSSENAGIEPPDVVRYSRRWTLFLG
jgi:hypothetical protein